MYITMTISADIIQNLTFNGFLILLVLGLAYLIYNYIFKRLNNQTYEDVVNERAKELINKLAERVDTLEQELKEVKLQLDKEREENIRIKILYETLLSKQGDTG